MSSLKQFIGNMVSKSKNNKQIDTYPTKPYSEAEKDKKIEINKKEKDKQDKYNKFQSSLIYYGTLKQQYIEKLNKKSKK